MSNDDFCRSQVKQRNGVGGTGARACKTAAKLNPRSCRSLSLRTARSVRSATGFSPFSESAPFILDQPTGTVLEVLFQLLMEERVETRPSPTTNQTGQ